MKCTSVVRRGLALLSQAVTTLEESGEPAMWQEITEKEHREMKEAQRWVKFLVESKGTHKQPRKQRQPEPSPASSHSPSASASAGSPGC